MSNITVLDQNTINQIAAGEVIERPAAVVKELVENSIDAGSNSVTIEIKEGGISFIRITDNGGGIQREDIALAFLRHSTSKIKSIEDLISVSSLGFRGEALSSIAAISQVELLTKIRGDLNGVRYVIESGEEKSLEDIGCPEGTTFIVRNLFYHTPARRKFLKSPATEAGYISDLMERIAVSHPEVAFKFIVNNQIKLHTSGNGELKDIIYHIYGRELSSNLLPIHEKAQSIQIEGFVGKPIVSRGNRNYMNYFINGRYIKSSIINKAIEEAYKSYTMTHRYPFTALHFQIDSELIDVNVHPTKMDIRFQNGEEIYNMILASIKKTLEGKPFIPDVVLVQKKEEVKKPVSIPEPFEINRKKMLDRPNVKNEVMEEETKKTEIEKLDQLLKIPPDNVPAYHTLKEGTSYNTQVTLFEEQPLSEKASPKYKIIGQLFSTYWIIQFTDKMLIIDQHAAHEKVLYEKLLKSIEKKEFLSQMVDPPIILTLSMREEDAIKKYIKDLNHIGFEIEAFGGKEYSVRAVPGDVFGIAQKELLIEMIDSLVEDSPVGNADIVLEKIASISCKAAVKGNNKLSVPEAEALIKELMVLDNPYNCPHGRPTIISMSKYEIEKKFKRIVT